MVERLLTFIDREYDAQTKEIKRIWALPLHTRVAEGEALNDITVIDKTLKGGIAVRCPSNISKFREGSMVRIHKGDPNSGVACEIEEDGGSTLYLKPGFNASLGGISGSGWILDNDLVDLRHILKNTVTAWSQHPTLYNEYGDILLGMMKPQLVRSRLEKAAQLLKNATLTSSQREAFARAYAARNYYLIQGPPGTGKTWLLAHLAHIFASEGQRVLITAFTHRAINNALVKTAKSTGFNHILKVGQKSNAGDLVWEHGQVPNYEYFRDAPYSTDTRGLIVGATCFAVRSKRLNAVRFDTVIFDEASQVTLPLAIAGMMAGAKHIFVGDHKQMAPVIVGQHQDTAMTRSIFETLFIHHPGTMLDTTFRMNAEINNFPSKTFYGGRLQSAPSVARDRLVVRPLPTHLKPLLDPDRPSVFLDLRHTNRGMRSNEEAVVITWIVQELLKGGVSAKEIAIIAPYRAQCRLIRESLRQKLSATDLEAIVVDTVERIQGQERDVILISLTTSDPTHAASRADFYFQPNRLNVAITRARKKRIVIGSSNVLATATNDPVHRQWIEVFKQFHASCHKVALKTPAVAA